MLKELNKKPLRNSIIWAVIFVAIAGFLLYSTGFGIFVILKGADPAESYSLDELEGKYVKLETNFIWEPFYYVGDTEASATEMGYMIATTKLENMEDFVDADYIAVAVKRGRFDEVEDLYDRGTLAFQGTGDAADLGNPLTFTGVVRQMDREELRFYNELLVDTGMDEGVSVATLILEDGSGPKTGNNADLGTIYVMSAIALALIVVAVVKVIKGCTGAYQKNLRAFCAASGDPTGTMARLEDFYANTRPLPGGIRADEELILFITGNDACVMHTEDVAWVYTSAIQHRRNGIPTGTTYSLMLADKAGKRYTISQSTESDSKEALQGLFPLCRNAVFGYDAQREKMFKKDRAAFAQIAAQQHQPVPVEQPQPVAEPTEAPQQPTE